MTKWGRIKWFHTQTSHVIRFLTESWEIKWCVFFGSVATGGISSIYLMKTLTITMKVFLFCFLMKTVVNILRIPLITLHHQDNQSINFSVPSVACASLYDAFLCHPPGGTSCQRRFRCPCGSADRSRLCVGRWGHSGFSSSQTPLSHPERIPLDSACWRLHPLKIHAVL